MLKIIELLTKEKMIYEGKATFAYDIYNADIIFI